MTTCDNGHTQVSNDLFDSLLSHPLSKRQQTIVLAVIRQTNGYNKTEDDISGKRFEQLTGIKATHCLAALRELEEMKVIHRRSGRFGQVVSINQKYNEWGMTESVNRQTKTVRGCDRNGQQQYTTKQKTTSKDNHNKGRDRKILSEWKLPDNVSKQSWNEFEAHRLEIKKPLTDLARTKNANILAGYATEVQQTIVDTTIANRWTGLFPPKNRGSSGVQSFTEQRVGKTTDNLIDIFGEDNHGQDYIPGEHAVSGSSLRRRDFETAGKRVLAPVGRDA